LIGWHIVVKPATEHVDRCFKLALQFHGGIVQLFDQFRFRFGCQVLYVGWQFGDRFSLYKRRGY
jgi:hypothetical protein